MAELLFIATTLFVAYVVFEAVGKKDKNESKQTSSEAATNPEPPAVTEEVSTPKPTKADKPVSTKAAKPTKKAATAKAAAPKPAAPKAAASKAEAATSDNSLRNPQTGEVAKIPNSYSFAKRWIKEALVEEGLLDKIYKTNEIDDATAEKIKEAFEQLKSMKKYQ
ncbi:MAG: hypothetical protein ACU836_04770 [Gammaproteobacteria bacterium]